jgi:adenine-specific DNA-methyltransferase
MHALASTATEMRTDETDGRTLLSIPDALRAGLFASVSPQRQKDLGQFLAPPHVADLMAEMFRLRSSHIGLLDAGAGMGILSAAFVRRQLLKRTPPKRIDVTAYELDKALIGGIEETYETCRVACRERGVQFSATIRNADFIAEGTEMPRSDLFSNPTSRIRPSV